jgi:hypothetical protein
MPNQQLSLEESLARKKRLINRLAIIIALLLLILAILTYFILKFQARAQFHQGVRTKDAYAGIKDYRERWNGSVYKKTKGVYYDPAVIRHYLDSIFPKLTAQVSLKPESKWVLGFYFMRTKNRDGNPRNSFYVVPTILNLKDSTIFDFYEDSTMYRSLRTMQRSGDDTLAYNAGELWP